MKRAHVAAVAVAALLWAVGGTYASQLISQGASPVELTEGRAWLTALTLVASRWVAGGGEGAGAVAPGWVVVFGFSIAATNFTYYAALARLPVAVAITIQYTAPGLVVSWTALKDRRPPPLRVLLALGGAVCGVALLTELPALAARGKLSVDAGGLGTAMASAVAFAVYMVAGERVARGLGARAAVTRGFVLASLLWVVVQGVRGRPHTLLDARFVPGVFVLAFVTTVAPFLLFVWGLERVHASRAGIVSTLEPLLATLFASLWLGQSLRPLQLAGALLVVAAIGVVQAERPPPPEVLVERAALD